ncbi:hypothetical protein BaRGS_00038984 [Batillaria attramentaria]|uniref:Uncharacterized protein n=1 Tax=Batillaria attramentaria TaxID=370345 RepID=A0ABD0J4C1_9CAEN
MFIFYPVGPCGPVPGLPGYTWPQLRRPNDVNSEVHVVLCVGSCLPWSLRGELCAREATFAWLVVMLSRAHRDCCWARERPDRQGRPPSCEGRQSRLGER